MQEAWFRGYKDREARMKEVRGYRNAFDALLELLEREYPPDIQPDYSKAGWEGDLAHQLGKKEALDRFKKILTIKE